VALEDGLLFAAESPQSEGGVLGAGEDELPVVAELDGGDGFGVPLEFCFVGHGLEVPDLEDCLVDGGDGFGLVAVADGPLLGKFEDDALIGIDIPDSEGFVVSNSDQRVAIFSVPNHPDDIKMCFDPLDFCSGVGIDYDQVVPAAKSQSPVIDRNGAGHCGELDLVLLRKEVDSRHGCSVEHARDHLRFVKNYFLEVGASEGALVEDGV
jgi:hypothetical protein